MKKTVCLFAFLVISLALPAAALAGPEGFSELDWREIPFVKGGAKTCVITAGKDDLLPDHKAFYSAQGKIVRLQIGLALTDFTYDSAGRLSEIKTGYLDEEGKYAPAGRMIYAYDAKGKLTSITSLDGEGKEVLKETGISYDAKGNVAIERLTPEGGVYKVETYNKDFLLIEEVVYTSESVAMGQKKREVESRSIYTYDKNGNLIEREVNETNPRLPNLPKKIVQKFTYRFDKHGNKLEQKTALAPKESRAVYLELDRPTLTFTYGYGDSVEKAEKSEPKSVSGKKVKVEWNGDWYPATILKEEGGKYLIHYDGYDSSWDEWVTQDRIKF